MRWSIGIGLICLAGCQGQSAADAAAPNDMGRAPALMIGEAPVPDHHAQILGAFAKAEQPTAENLIEAAQTLEKLGATPLAGVSDLSKTWTSQAIKIDPDIINKNPPYRGRVKGAAYRQVSLSPDEVDEITEIFYAAEEAVLTLTTMDHSLELWVVAQDRDEPVCKLYISSHSQACSWRPIYTAPYTIKIRNTSTDAARYILVSN